MNHSLELLALVTCLLLPVSMAFSQAKEDSVPLQGFTEFAERVRSEWAVPGMAVAVIKGADVAYMNGFGYRDVEKKLPVTTKSLFAIGSCTKAFTAMAIGLLVDDRKLDWDTPLIDYLPDFRLYDDYATLHATPRDLLCHRTGIPGYDALWILSLGSREEFCRRLRYLEPNAGFRDIFQYNNLMYMVAGTLAGRLGGGTWEKFVAARIFRPLGMEHSNFSVTESQKAGDFAQPYMTFTGKPEKVPFRNLDPTGPAGSINSSIEDMAKWVMLHINKGLAGDSRLISKTSLEEMYLPHVTIRDPGQAKMAQSTTYGQGWYISDYRGHRLVEHGGNIDGFSALVSLLPEKSLGVVVLSNSMNFATHVLARDICDRLLFLDKRDWNSHYKNHMNEIMEMFAASRGAKKEPRADTRPSLPLSEYPGLYEHPAFGRVEVRADYDKLTAHFQSGLIFVLEHFHFDRFSGTASDFYLPALDVRFHLGVDGAVESLSLPLQEGVSDIVFKRVQKKPEGQMEQNGQYSTVSGGPGKKGTMHTLRHTYGAKTTMKTVSASFRRS